MLTLTVEPGQSVTLGQAIQYGKKTVYVWAIDGDELQVSCDAPRDIGMLRKYAEINGNRRSCNVLSSNALLRSNGQNQ